MGLRAFAAIRNVVLVILFRRPGEGRGRRDARGDVVPFRAARRSVFQPSRAGPVSYRRPPNGTGRRCRVRRPTCVGRESRKEPRQLFVGDFRRIERHPHRFGMSRTVATHTPRKWDSPYVRRCSPTIRAPPAPSKADAHAPEQPPAKIAVSVRSFFAAGTNSSDTELTQWRVFRKGVKPSPVKTWPR